MTKVMAAMTLLFTAFGGSFLLGQEPFEKDPLNSRSAVKEESFSEAPRESSDESPTTLKVDAGDLFNDALAEAKRQNKNVFLVFVGPSCAPCKVLKKFLALQAEFFDKDYIVLHIDLARTENGQLIKERFTSDPSVPWTVIVNPVSEVLCTSVGDKGNIGFPTAIEECKHFISMIEKSSIRSKNSDFERLARELNDFAEPMRRTAEQENDASEELDSKAWIGEWQNIDVDAQDITRLVITLDDSRLLIRAFGKCEPTDCDWGSTGLRLCRSVGSKSKNETVAFGKWDHGFQDAYIILRLTNGKMLCEAFSIYKDQSERASIVTTEKFHRSKSQEGETSR